MDTQAYERQALLTAPQPGELHLDDLPPQALAGALNNIILFGKDIDVLKKLLVYGRERVPDEKVATLSAYKNEEFRKLILSPNEDPEAIRVLTHATLGIISEAAELAEMAMTVLFGGDEIDRRNGVEESGDLLWYNVRLCQASGSSLGESMAKNNAKLEERHLSKTGGFNPNAATEAGRDRSAENAAMDRAADNGPALTPQPQRNFRGDPIPTPPEG